MRLAVYTDYVYRRRGETIYADRAFALFLIGLVPFFDELNVLGRLVPEPGEARYPLPPGMRFTALPYYSSLAHPHEVARATWRSLSQFWRALAEADVVWLLGPSPFAVAFAGLALLRRRRLVLGVRQDYPAYLEARHPGRTWIRLVGGVLEAAFQAMARRAGVVAVGPQIARRYGASGRVLEISVSLTSERDVVAAEASARRSYDGELRVLSVGRLEEEKNPLMLADVVARLREHDGGRWRLTVCGEGPLRDALDARLRALGVEDHVELLGYVPHEELTALYRSSHAFLHVSWTEGLPQVLGEAFAAGLPTVATGVGGITEAVGDQARLIPPGDPEAAVRELRRIAHDAVARAELIELGRRWALEHSSEQELARVRDFLRGAPCSAPAAATSTAEHG